MPFAVQTSHKVVSLFAAVAVTLTLQNSMLAGFSHLADQAQASAQANCSVATLPTVTVTGTRS